MYYASYHRLRYWCQKVLPLVYDDSLSYYEVLDKLTYDIAHLAEDVNKLILDGIVPNFGGEWSASQTYPVGTIVYTEGGMATYVSTQDVPVNTPITNTEYWQVILNADTVQDNLEEELGEYKDQIDAAIAEFEQTVGGNMDTFEQQIQQDFSEYTAVVDGKLDGMEQDINGMHDAIDDVGNDVQELKDNLYYVTPEMYGALHDNSADDGPAIEAALNSGYTVKLLSKEFNYIVKTPVTITTACARLIGPDTNWISNVGNSAGITLTANGVFIANAEYFQVRNVYFYSYDRSTGSTSAIIVNGPNGLDGDAEISDCIFSGVPDTIVANSRGLIVRHCLFARGTPCVTLNYVGTTTSLSPVTHSNVTGGRRFIVDGNTFHSGCAVALLTQAGSSVSDFAFTNNECDVGEGEIRLYGTIYAGRIENNTWNLANRRIVNSGGATIKNLIIANNLFRGMNGYSMPDVFISFGGQGDVSDMLINNNVFTDCEYQCIYFSRETALTRLTISDNAFNNIDMVGDNITYGAIILPDAFDGVIITGNNFGKLAETEAGCAIRVAGQTEEGSLSKLVVQNNIKVYDKDYLVHSYLQEHATDSLIQTYRLNPTP